MSAKFHMTYLHISQQICSVTYKGEGAIRKWRHIFNSEEDYMFVTYCDMWDKSYRETAELSNIFQPLE